MSDDVEVWRRQAERERKARLEAEAIAERTTRELYETIETLRALNESLAAPVLFVQSRVLLVPLVGTIDRQRIQRFAKRMLHACREQRARALVIDLTGVVSLEGATAGSLSEAVIAAHLLGVRVVLTGIAQQVAQAFSEVHLDNRLEFAGDLASGLALVSDTLGE